MRKIGVDHNSDDGVVVAAAAAVDGGVEGEGVDNTGSKGGVCWELTTLWVARLDNGVELKVTDPKEQQGDVEKEEAEG